MALNGYGNGYGHAGGIYPHDVYEESHVLERVDYLRRLNEPYLADRLRIRQIMNGGSDGLLALFKVEGGSPAAEKLSREDWPVVHMLDSGLSKFAQRLGRMPELRVPSEWTKKSGTAAALRRAQKRERIVHAYDQNTRLEMMLPQLARWVPGYGYALILVRDGRSPEGWPYPTLELRDPYTTWPGTYGVDQVPNEVATARMVPQNQLAKVYPRFAEWLSRQSESGVLYNSSPGGAGTIYSPGNESWEGPLEGCLVVEYECETGTYVCVPEYGMVLDHVPNPLSCPRFVLLKRYSFDRMISQYQHVIGLMAMMAKLNMLSVMASEDAVFSETNVIGDIDEAEYRRGRFAVNRFPPGTNVTRPQQNANFGLFEQINRIERQLRIGSSYPLIDDSQSPISYTTGAGLRELTVSADAQLAEYQTVFRQGLSDLDALRLEWDDRVHASVERPLLVTFKGKTTAETYIPKKHIYGAYATRRIYGVMAGWDEAQKIVGGLQLLQAELISRQVFMENLDGLENIDFVVDQIRSEKAERFMFDMLLQAASQGDPTASMALTEIMANPNRTSDILKKHFTPQEPQMAPEEEQFLEEQAGGPAGMPQPGAPPEDIMTILSRLEGSGGAEGGAQTVGSLPPEMAVQ